MLLPTPGGVAAAAALLSDRIVRTPLLESPILNEQLGCRLFVKAECLQRTGSFKYRGALHRLLRLEAEDPPAASRGVVAFSSGNFGQALAAAAAALGTRCCVVSPHDAPSVKLERIQQYGAELVLSEADKSQNREVAASALAEEISQRDGMTLLHPFEDADVVHGQGTCGLELLEQAQQQIGSPKDEEPQLETIVVPCGGGGLTAGICLAVEQHGLQNRVGVVTIEPRGYDDHARSFADPERRRLSLEELYPPNNNNNNGHRYHRSLECDALMAGAPGKTTWGINSSRLSGALASTGDDSAARAMKVAFEHFRLVLEPSGALGLAAVLDGQIDLTRGRPIAVIASGGNTDWDTFARLVG